MRHLISKYSRLKLVIITTLFAVLLTKLMLYIGYNAFDVEVRFSEEVISLLAPVIIASSVTWFLFDLIKKLDKLEKNMRYIATYDPLTNTLTRKVFFEKTEYLLKASQRSSQEIVIMMIDIDFFKKINDTYGHIAGDFVLKKFGEMLNQNKRETDYVGRYGGEEFIVFLWGISSSAILNYTENLHKSLGNLQLQYDGNNIHITMSIGVSVVNRSNRLEIKEFIKQADMALYEAKQSGRNKTIVYDSKRAKNINTKF